MTERSSVHVQGLGHGSAPIPLASRVGPLLASGGLNGMDRATGTFPEDLRAEVAALFSNVAAVMAAVDSSPAAIVKMTFFSPDRSIREALDAEWVSMFPDPDSRPARHLLVQEINPIMRVQCEILAWLG